MAGYLLWHDLLISGEICNFVISPHIRTGLTIHTNVF